LRDTNILILDEASSALDSNSEQKLVEAIDSLRQNRTTLIIAHRFSSIRTANRVLYFSGDGKIIAGTHDELLHKQNDYKRAVEWQLSQT
jgi:ABC-type multidrug transport system fused ATPase/permease subunit